MTIDEAYAEMKRRGWGFARNGRMIAIGKITNNNDYQHNGHPPMLEIISMGLDPVETLERAIAKADGQ